MKIPSHHPRIIKMTLLFACLGLCARADGYAQNIKVDLQVESRSLGEAFELLKRQTSLVFFFSNREVDLDEKVSASFVNTDLEVVLKELLGRRYAFRVTDNMILVRPASQTVEPLLIRGLARDESGHPLQGVNVRVKGATAGASTNRDGRFQLTATRDTLTLLFSFVGMEEQAIRVNPADRQEIELEVTMKEKQVELADIVVTGIFTRQKESFTGSAATYSSAELKEMGSRNVLQGLKTLDPAFAIIEDNLYGSDPNRLPNMEIRGKSSVLGLRDELETDPNQPLFILDGFESTLAAINDLDINRVASITILKDAASTAIYGSKAANGVVVVETVKPEAGELQVNYNGNLNLTIPDLSSYNLMNAREKLDFEALAGRYASNSAANLGINYYDYLRDLHAIYQTKLQDILAGVDTYWLAEPLRVGVNQRHALYLMGGEGNFLFGLGANYNGVTGAMKRSFRETFGGNIDLIYRVATFQFSNKFSFTATSLGNPVVSFQEYAEANPYHRKRDDEGEINKWLENNDYFQSSNPLWNDRLNSRDRGRSLDFSNYFTAEWTPAREWKARLRFGISYNTSDAERFYSREDTRYENTEALRRGEFFATSTTATRYEGEASVTYAKLIARHRLNLVAGGNIFNNNSLVQGYSVEGFPAGDFTYPSFANGYPEDGSPTYRESVSRSVNGYFNAGYAFDDRYLADFSLRTSGSSLFGTTRKYNTTWSVGLGWNIHNEPWVAETLPQLDLLKLRASIGNPGNQSFESAQTVITYAFQYGAVNYFGLGALLDQVGNPDLKWQTTVDRNIGLDLTLLDKRLSLATDYYYKVTDPLLIRVNVTESSGAAAYLTNAGEQRSSGWTLAASYYILRDLERRLAWQVRLNARTQSSRVDKIGNLLYTLNKNGRGANTVRYYDGADPNDIWAVRSLGIDPSNGKELFLDKDGNFTHDFSYDDEVICGNARPDLEGVIGTSFAWSGLSLTLNFRYSLGADLFNTALYQKVENIRASDMSKNQDRRAFYDRWQKPGDVVPFKNVASVLESPISSRFVQRENLLIFESLNIGYEFIDGWIRRVGLSSLKLQFSARDLFRASSVRAERGIAYPFARDAQAGLSFNF